MGIARVSCWGTCTCIDHVVDGHIDSKEGTRKVTVFTEHTFEAALSHLDADNVTNEQCGVTVLVTNASSSGGHIFKIRDILLHVSASTCDVDRVTRHFFSVREYGDIWTALTRFLRMPLPPSRQSRQRSHSSEAGSEARCEARCEVRCEPSCKAHCKL
jgi:hypothetical protein